MDSKHVLDEWNRAAHWLVPALEEDTEDEVLNDLLTNQAQLWRGERGAFVTRLQNDPEPHVCVWLGGGDLRDLLAMQPGIEAWGRWHGAKSARVNGRKGWARVLQKTGFEPDGDELRKVL